MTVDILALGEPMVEFNQTGGAASAEYLQGFGGDTSNFAVAAARQGAKAGYISAVGADAYGKMLREMWTRENVDHSTVREDSSAPTGVYFVTHGGDGHHFSFLRAGSAASRYRAADLPRHAIQAAKLVHLSGISLAISPEACDAGFAAMEMARAAGVRVSFDTNLRLKLWPATRARAIVSEAIRLCDVCLPSLDDVAVLYGERDPDRLVDLVLGMGPKLVALKLGAHGTLVADSKRRVRVAPHPCKPVDATGAGDTFGGAFAARLVAGDDMVDAARYAACAAALSTEGYGAVAPIPDRARVLAALARSGS
jgi:2-dehydro-3-deoxygluconokinase